MLIIAFCLASLREWFRPLTPERRRAIEAYNRERDAELKAARDKIWDF